MQPIPLSLLDAQRLTSIAHIISNHTTLSDHQAMLAASQCLGYQDVGALTAAIQNPIDMTAHTAYEVEKTLRSNMRLILGEPIPELARLGRAFCCTQTLEPNKREEAIKAITSSSELNQQVMTYASFMQNEPIQCLNKHASKLKNCFIADHVSDAILQEGNFFKLTNQANEDRHFTLDHLSTRRPPINTTPIPFVHFKHESVSLIVGLPTYLDEILYSQCPNLMNKQHTIRPMLICAFCTATGKQLWQASFHPTPKGIKRTTPILTPNPYTLQRLEIKPAMMDNSDLANDGFSSLVALCGTGGIFDIRLMRNQDTSWTLEAKKTRHHIPKLGIVIYHYEIHDTPRSPFESAVLDHIFHTK
ncbi:hypothetical protein ACP3V3_19785 [Vibrio sp. PNB22_3_1]